MAKYTEIDLKKCTDILFKFKSASKKIILTSLIKIPAKKLKMGTRILAINAPLNLK